MIDQERFTKTAAAYGISVSHCIGALDRYAEILVDYNQKVNLTAITDPEGIEVKHFLDSLLFAAQPEVAGSLVDVGSGAGFPGVVAKLYNPALKLTLMEPTGKRADFLRYLCAELGITAGVVKERAEEAARKQWREAFDVACARGVAALNKLSEYCLPLVKTGGLFIAMKANVEEELRQAKGAFTKLGAAYLETRRQSLPDGSARSLVFVKKISQTSTVYPRNGGKIAKAPLN